MVLLPFYLRRSKNFPWTTEANGYELTVFFFLFFRSGEARGEVCSFYSPPLFSLFCLFLRWTLEHMYTSFYLALSTFSLSLFPYLFIYSWSPPNIE